MASDIRWVYVVTRDGDSRYIINPDHARMDDVRIGSDKGNRVEVSVDRVVSTFNNVRSVQVMFSDGEVFSLRARELEKGDYTLNG